MKRRSTRALLAWSLIGLIGGHQATYLAVYQDPGVVEDVLAATGHGWLWLAPVFLLSALLTAMVVGFQGAEPVRAFRWRFTFLALIQGATFLAIELAERGSTGLDFDALVGGADGLILLLGVAIQTIVAAALALASRVVERVAAAIRQARRPANPRRHRSGPARRPALVILPRPHRPGPTRAPRAPPVLL